MQKLSVEWHRITFTDTKENSIKIHDSVSQLLRSRNKQIMSLRNRRGLEEDRSYHA